MTMTRLDLFRASLAYEAQLDALDAARATMARPDVSNIDYARALSAEGRALHELRALQPLHERHLDECEERARDCEPA